MRTNDFYQAVINLLEQGVPKDQVVRMISDWKEHGIIREEERL